MVTDAWDAHTCLGMDELAMYPESRHWTVLCNGELFIFEVISNEGTLLDEAGIQTKLEEIQLYAAAKVAAGPGHGSLVALLTSENRDLWAEARAAIEAVPGNRENLRVCAERIHIAQKHRRMYICLYTLYSLFTKA